MKHLRLAYWKWQLKRRYCDMRDYEDDAHCGITLLRNISGTHQRLEQKVNEAIRKVNELDPSAKLVEFK
jgi:hypothetical protein